MSTHILFPVLSIACGALWAFGAQAEALPSKSPVGEVVKGPLIDLADKISPNLGAAAITGAEVLSNSTPLGMAKAIAKGVFHHTPTVTTAQELQHIKDAGKKTWKEEMEECMKDPNHEH